MHIAHTILAKLLLALLLVLSIGAAQAQPESAEATDDLSFYAMLDTKPTVESGPPVARIFERFAPFANRRAGARPMLIWYHWANQPKPFLSSFLLMLFASVVFTSLVPGFSQIAQTHCKARFWRTFFVGLLIAVLCICGVRIGLLTMIGWPMAVFLAGGFQLALLAGLSVMVLLIGQSLGYYAKMEKWIARPDARRLAYLVVGALVCAALIQIPGVGILPKIGTRLVMMLALVGLGGLWRARRGIETT